MSVAILSRVFQTKSRLMSEMTDRERLLRAKRLIEQGAPAGLREAEQLLKPLSLALNPATQIIGREMSPFEAVMYIDTLLQSKYSSTSSGFSCHQIFESYRSACSCKQFPITCIYNATCVCSICIHCSSAILIHIVCAACILMVLWWRCIRVHLVYFCFVF